MHATVTSPCLYHLGDVYVYPSRLDGIGLSVPEVLACGLPVITTDVPPCNEFIVNGLNGWVVPVSAHRQRHDEYYWPETECDLDALRSTMQLLVDNSNLLPKWKTDARCYAERYLDWTRNASMLKCEVQKILSQPHKPIDRRIKYEIQNTYSHRPSIVWRIEKRIVRALKHAMK